MLKNKDINLAEFQKMSDAHKESHDADNPRDFIDSYITRMNEEKNNPNTTFTGRNECFMFKMKWPNVKQGFV